MSAPLVCGVPDVAIFEGTGLYECADQGSDSKSNPWLVEMNRNRVHRDILSVLNMNANQEIQDTNAAKNSNA